MNDAEMLMRSGIALRRKKENPKKGKRPPPPLSSLLPPSDQCDCDSVMFHPDIMDGMGHIWAYNAHGIPPGCMTLSPLSIHIHDKYCSHIVFWGR